jgi:CRP/FNR family transcriptional regulator, cyclic AMP receptor protein
MITQKRGFNPSTFLTTSGSGRKLINFTKGQPIYAQGDAANSLFIVQDGTVKLSIKSQTGKEAILDILSKADFVGKDSLSGVSTRTASASALTDSRLLRITKEVMLLALKRQVKLANVFWAYLLQCNIRYQQDLADQHCNLSEKRLAHISCGSPTMILKQDPRSQFRRSAMRYCLKWWGPRDHEFASL